MVAEDKDRRDRSREGSNEGESKEKKFETAPAPIENAWRRKPDVKAGEEPPSSGVYRPPRRDGPRDDYRRDDGRREDRASHGRDDGPRRDDRREERDDRPRRDDGLRKSPAPADPPAKAKSPPPMPQYEEPKAPVMSAPNKFALLQDDDADSASEEAED